MTTDRDPNPDLGDDARFASSTTIERQRTTDFTTHAHELLTTQFTRTRRLVGTAIQDTYGYPVAGGASGALTVDTSLVAPFTTNLRGDVNGHTPTTTITRDPQGRVTCIESMGSFPTQITYTGSNQRPTTIRQAAFGPGCSGTPSCTGTCPTREVSLGYTAPRWLHTISTGTGSSALTTTLSPNPLTGWVEHVQEPGHVDTIDITYDDRGNVLTFSPPSRPTHTFTVTQRDLSSTYTPPSTASLAGAEVATTTYTDDGQLHVVELADGRLQLDYDPVTGTIASITGGDAAFPIHLLLDSGAFGQPLTIAGDGSTSSYDYDVMIPARESSVGPAGRSASVRWVVGSALMLEQEQVSLGVGASSASATLAYTYDADAVVQTATVTSPASAASATTSLRFTRGAPTAPVCGTPLDPSCGWTPLTITATSPTFATTTTAISVSPFGELRSMSTTASYVSGPLYEAEICARDSQGRITDRRELLPASGTLPRQVFHHFDYDAAGRLRRDRGYSGRAMAETCTSWLAAFTSNPMLAADRGADTTMGYDDNGNLSAGPASSCSDYDAADRPICRPRRSYNRRGQLTSPGHGDTVAYDVLGRLRSFRHGGTRVSYDWDPAGRLAHIGGSSTGEEYFVYDGSRVRAWRRGADTSFFVYGTMGHVPDLMYRDVGSHGTTMETYRLITDERGSVRLVVRVDGGTPGTIAQRIDYDVWGVPTFVSGDARTQPFGFAGGLWLRDASLWRFGARDYDPSIGAWTAHDPIGFEGGENQYAYCGGDPVNRVDPPGLEDWGDVAWDIWNLPGNLTGAAEAVSGSSWDDIVYDSEHETFEAYNNSVPTSVGLGALTNGRVICYSGGREAASRLRAHELAHVEQGTYLGPWFGISNLIGQVYSATRWYVAPLGGPIEGRSPYAAYNFLEQGPYSDPPVPFPVWPWTD